MLIITEGLGNCGKGAGNGSLEKDSSSYSSKEWLYICLLICPALFHCPIQHGLGGEGWKYAATSDGIFSGFVIKCKGFCSKSIKMKGKNETVERWVILNGCNFCCSSVGNLVYFHVPIDYLSSASYKEVFCTKHCDRLKESTLVQLSCCFW